jgi:hypothetical protein
MKSWKKPTPDQIDRAVALIGQSGHYRYFFDRLENPEWIKPLQAKGFFGNPPPPDRDEEKGTIGFPPWPESLYLARMASVNPETVFEVIIHIPNTENVRVNEDLVDAALTMPPELAAKLVEKAKAWARSPYHLLLPEKLGNLVAHLAQGRETDAALDLARVLLEVLPDQKRQEKTIDDDTYSLPPEAKARFDQWDYEETLKKDIPELVKAAGIRAFDFLCDLLETAIRLSRRDGEKGVPEDHSYIWRPAIENHPQNIGHALKDSLVTSVRDAAESIVQIESGNINELVERLESRPWRVFHRIALHLLRCFPDTSLELIVERLTDRDLFEEGGCRHEYILLLGDCYSLLSSNQQKVILGWIEQGPDLEEFKKIEEEFTGKRPTDEEAQRYRRYWQRDRLAWFKKSLPKKWKHHYEKLVTELGEPEHPEFESYSESWVGPTSPKSAEELKAMTVSDIAEFCKTWQPSGNRMTPSPEGLGRALSPVVEEDPARFSDGASEFLDLGPTYVRALLSGFRDALKKERTFDWIPVLDLCNRVLKQPQEINGSRHEERDKDPHWGWTRKTIASLISAGLKEGSGYIPFDLRKTVWEIIEPLTEDPDPTPEEEASYEGPNMDPTTLSINTTRGEAMHAVVHYGLWVRRHLEKESNVKERLAHGFDEMPEVREVLENHLDISCDPSLAIRAVYGQWFPWIVLLDKEWAKRHAGQIFPPKKGERHLWAAAWNAYIIWCKAYDEVFDVLCDQYAQAVERLGEVGKEIDHLMNPESRLGEHLVVFYWRGKLDLDHPESLLVRFWEKASPSVKGWAIQFVGRSLTNDKASVQPEIIKRLEALWEKRLSEAKSTPDKENFLPEMVAFGWWFASAKFDDKWSIEQLLEALRITQKTDPDHLVVERLAVISESMPMEAVQCLEYLVKGDKEGLKLHRWREKAKRILSSALQAQGSALEKAEDLIHYLGSRGYLEFRSILRSSS